jgi:hypothetical protein
MADTPEWERLLPHVRGMQNQLSNESRSDSKQAMLDSSLPMAISRTFEEKFSTTRSPPRRVLVQLLLVMYARNLW